MQQSKLLQLFKVLETDEVKRLLTFLKSPFYNSNPNIIRLYQLLRSHHPEFTSQKLDKENIFSKLFPRRAYDHQKLLNLMSDFNKLLTKYLQLLQLEKQEWEQQRLLLEAYAERPRHYQLFRKAWLKVQKNLEKSPKRDGDYYRRLFQMQLLFLNHPGTNKFQITKVEYDLAMEYLDRAFGMEKLLLSCEMKAREKPLSEHYEIWLLDEISQPFVNEIGEEHLLYRTYREMLTLLEIDSSSSFLFLKSVLFDKGNRFTRRQQEDILQSLVNFTIQQGNRGHRNYVQENLQLYQFGLREKLFIQNGLLNDMTYISIVNIALRADARTWCEEFINEYECYLEPSAQKDAKSLGTAFLLYANQRLNETIELLQTVDFLNVYYQIQARVLLIKVYFENLQQDETYYDLVFSQSTTFERYLRRNKKIAKHQRIGLMNFCNSIKRLAKIKFFKTYGRGQLVTELREEITSLSPFYNKSWFLQQLD